MMDFSNLRNSCAIVTLFFISLSCSVVGGSSQAVASNPLTQLASPYDCISNDSASGCGTLISEDLIKNPRQIAVSPDGTSVYLVSDGDGYGGEVSDFQRSSNGALTYKDCAADKDAGSSYLCSSLTPSSSYQWLQSPTDVAVSPDGKNVYVTASEREAVISFSRNTSTGELTYLGCFNDSESAIGACGSSYVDGLEDPMAVVVSPDGKNVYVGSSIDDSIVTLKRNSSNGSLSYSGTDSCISYRSRGDVYSETACSTRSGTFPLDGITSLAIDSTGEHLYAGGTYGVTVLSRESDSTSSSVGKLTLGSCLSVSSSFSSCSYTTELKDALYGTQDIAVSPNDEAVYVAASGTYGVVSSLSRSGDTLSLTGCVSNYASSCAETNSDLHSPGSIAATPDGTGVLMADKSGYGIWRFAADQNSGVVAFDDYNCIGSSKAYTPPASCTTQGAGLLVPYDVAVDPDGKNAYVADRGLSSDAISAFSIQEPATSSSGATGGTDSGNGASGGTGGSGSGSGGTTGSGGQTPAVAVALSISKNKLKVKSKAIPVQASCAVANSTTSDSCTVTLKLKTAKKVKYKGKKRIVTIAKKTVSLTPGTTTTIKLKPNKACLKMIKRLRKLSVNIYGSVIYGTASGTQTVKKIKLRK